MGLENRAKLEARLRVLEGRELSRSAGSVKGKPKIEFYDKDRKKGTAALITPAKTYNPTSDLVLDKSAGELDGALYRKRKHEEVPAEEEAAARDVDEEKREEKKKKKKKMAEDYSSNIETDAQVAAEIEEPEKKKKKKKKKKAEMQTTETESQNEVVPEVEEKKKKKKQKLTESDEHASEQD